MRPFATETTHKSGSRLRPIWYGLRMSKSEMALARRLAAAEGASLAEVLRLCIVNEAARLGLEPEPQQQGLEAGR